MTATPMPVTAAPKVHRHRVLACVAGLLIGLGAVLMLFVYGVVPLGWVPLVVGLVVGALVGVLLVSVMPTRGRAR